MSFHVCIILSLFAMVLEGVDWVTWKNMDNMRRIWEDKDGYSCSNGGHTCVCRNTATNTNYSKLIHQYISIPPPPPPPYQHKRPTLPIGLVIISIMFTQKKSSLLNFFSSLQQFPQRRHVPTLHHSLVSSALLLPRQSLEYSCPLLGLL